LGQAHEPSCRTCRLCRTEQRACADPQRLRGHRPRAAAQRLPAAAPGRAGQLLGQHGAAAKLGVEAGEHCALGPPGRCQLQQQRAQCAAHAWVRAVQALLYRAQAEAIRHAASAVLVPAAHNAT
ncbi:hypothetical protein IWW47_006024, partial [Coemansia sp. RSA 2052]